MGEHFEQRQGVQRAPVDRQQAPKRIGGDGEPDAAAGRSGGGGHGQTINIVRRIGRAAGSPEGGSDRAGRPEVRSGGKGQSNFLRRDATQVSSASLPGPAIRSQKRRAMYRNSVNPIRSEKPWRSSFLA